MIRTAVVGCGGMGNHHAGILADLDGVELVSVCDLIEEKARATGERVGVECCTDFRGLIDKVDSMWICTEPFNRLDIVTACAEAGKHVFTEKPVSVNMDEADAMIEACRKANVKYMLGYVLRFTNPYRLMRETLVSGELGELVSCWTRRLMPFDMSDLWYGHQEKSGGVLLDFGSHDIDWLLWLGGPAKTVTAHTHQVRPTMNADEHGQAMILFENGGMAACEVSWSSYLGDSSVGLVGTKGAMIVGRDGKIRKKIGDEEEQIMEAEGAMAVDVEGNVGRETDEGEIETVGQETETIQEYFFRCIREDVEPLTSAVEGRNVLATVLAMQESARCGRSVEVAEVADKRPRLSCRPATSEQ